MPFTSDGGPPTTRATRFSTLCTPSGACARVREQMGGGTRGHSTSLACRNLRLRFRQCRRKRARGGVLHLLHHVFDRGAAQLGDERRHRLGGRGRLRPYLAHQHRLAVVRSEAARAPACAEPASFAPSTVDFGLDCAEADCSWAKRTARGRRHRRPCLHSRSVRARTLNPPTLRQLNRQQDAQGDHLLHLGRGPNRSGRGRDQGEARCGTIVTTRLRLGTVVARPRSRSCSGRRPAGPARAAHRARNFSTPQARARSYIFFNCGSRLHAVQGHTATAENRPRSPAALRGRPLWSAERARGAARCIATRGGDPGTMRPLGERLAEPAGGGGTSGPSAHACGARARLF